MNQPTKPMSFDEILVSFYNEVEPDVLDSRNSGGNGRVITEGHTKAKAHLIELVESNKPICYQGEASVEAIIYAIKKLAQYEQALIKAIKGEDNGK